MGITTSLYSEIKRTFLKQFYLFGSQMAKIIHKRLHGTCELFKVTSWKSEGWIRNNDYNFLLFINIIIKIHDYKMILIE